MSQHNPGLRGSVHAGESGDVSQQSKAWAHAPTHWVFESGIYMVTAGTYRKEPLFAGSERLDLLQEKLFSVTGEFGWRLKAWAIFPNHYHFIACSSARPDSLSKMLGKVHMQSAKYVNEVDKTPGRKVWFQFWDSLITYEKSYLARLNYVMNNPVKHGVLDRAVDYRWCSRAWFEQTAAPAFIKTVESFKTDSLKLKDDF